MISLYNTPEVNNLDTMKTTPSHYLWRAAVLVLRHALTLHIELPKTPDRCEPVPLTVSMKWNIVSFTESIVAYSAALLLSACMTVFSVLD